MDFYTILILCTSRSDCTSDWRTESSFSYQSLGPADQYGAPEAERGTMPRLEGWLVSQGQAMLVWTRP
jgi:hypothetical protein